MIGHWLHSLLDFLFACEPDTSRVDAMPTSILGIVLMCGRCPHRLDQHHLSRDVNETRPRYECQSCTCSPVMYPTPEEAEAIQELLTANRLVADNACKGCRGTGLWWEMSIPTWSCGTEDFPLGHRVICSHCNGTGEP